MIYDTCMYMIHFSEDTYGWQSRDFEAITRSHSSVFLDRRLNPRQETRDAGVDRKVLPIARIPIADNPNKDMGPFLHDCKWPTAVSLEVNHNTVNEMTFWFGEPPCMVLSQHPLHTQSGFRPHPRPGSFSLYSSWSGQ